MKKYYNTRQVYRDMENGTLSHEEGEKILAEMQATVDHIEHDVYKLEHRMDKMTKKLEKGTAKMEKGIARFVKTLEKKLP